MNELALLKEKLESKEKLITALRELSDSKQHTITILTDKLENQKAIIRDFLHLVHKCRHNLGIKE